MHIPEICLSFYKQRSKDKIFSSYPVAWLTIFYVFSYAPARINVVKHKSQPHKQLNKIT